MRHRKTLAAIGMTAAIATGGVVGATLGNPLASGAQDDTTTTAPAEPGTGTEKGERHHRGPFDLEAAAEALGLSTDELRTQLRDGKTLTEVAEAQGVAKQDLIDALVAAGEERLDEVKAELPERIAELVDRQLPDRGEGGPGGGGPGGRGPGLDAAAEALGLTDDELRSELRDGKTLAQIAEEKGVSVDDVIAAIAAERAERIDQAVADGKLTEEEAAERKAESLERITTMVNEGFRRGPGGHDGPPPADGDAPEGAPGEGD